MNFQVLSSVITSLCLVLPKSPENVTRLLRVRNRGVTSLRQDTVERLDSRNVSYEAIEYFKFLAFYPDMRDRNQPEEKDCVFKMYALSLAEGARPVRPEAVQKEGRSHLDGGSMGAGPRGDLPVRLRGEALQRVDAKPLRRRQGTPLAAFFNTPSHGTVLALDDDHRR